MIFLGLGSNKGNRHAQIARALGELSLAGVHVLRCASLIETPPWGNEDQPAFINTVVEVAYDGSAQELLTIVLSIETNMGRIREEKWGPRVIDIDILEFRRHIIDEPGLQIPHPWYTSRAFVLRSMVELEPYWVPTGGDESVSGLLEKLT
ncbi:MAG: 2-amino-4-hydroxy-6-hydroxymethyldihydropteridine diphosphokinase [Bacteroidia bacterium]